MQTEAADLMEAFMALFDGREGAATEGRGLPDAAETMITPPMSALSAPPTTLAELYGAEGLLAEMRAAADGPEMAVLLSDLRAHLDDPAFSAMDTPEAPRRLIEYVYPVV